jgi:hypothetical protein
MVRVGPEPLEGWILDCPMWRVARQRNASKLETRLIAILPIHIRLQMLSKTAALTLLTIPHSSQLIQRLGPPWCSADELDDNIPLTPHPSPNTPLTRLAALVPQEAR